MFKCISICISVLLLNLLARPQLAVQAPPNPSAIMGLSQIPLWPQNGDTSLYPNQYVFLEITTGNLVVAYPRSLEGGSSERNPFHVYLPTHIRPLVGLKFRKLADGRYSYEY
jgi:hypothetical protein